MIQMTFKRYETKYLLSHIMAHKLQRALPGHLQMDEYGLDTICSLYYDTPDDQLIRRSLEKPVYKEKLRLRSYGPAEGTQLIEQGWYLMEVKTPGAVPLWFSKILDDLEIYPTAFSKYGRAYQLKNQKTEEELSHPLVFENKNINKNLGGICYA